MRRRKALKRQINPDPKYKSKIVSAFVNVCMQSGKRSTAERAVYNAMDIATQGLDEKDAVKILEKAIQNSRPLLQLKSRRVGGATYQIPIEVKEDTGVTMAMRWIRDAARGKKGRSMQEKLADEFKDAYNGQGAAVKKRDEVHRMAEANRAFSHYRW